MTPSACVFCPNGAAADRTGPGAGHGPAGPGPGAGPGPAGPLLRRRSGTGVGKFGRCPDNGQDRVSGSHSHS